MIIKQRNDRYDAMEYGISFPVWFPRYRYVMNIDEYDWIAPRFHLVFGRIFPQFVRRCWHVRFGIQ